MSKAKANGASKTWRAVTAWACVGALCLGTASPALAARPSRPAPTPSPAPDKASTDTPAPAQAAAEGSPESALTAYAAAVNAFKYQDFDSAIPQFRALIYPKTRLDQKREWKAREYLGAALWWQGEAKLAADEFTALLVRNPQTVLDPAVYPPKMINEFDGLRANLVRLGVLTPDQAPRPPEQRDLLPTEPAPLPLMFFPFGVGQFANQEPVKGTTFLLVEAALGAVSATYYINNLYDGVHTGKRSTTGDIVQISTGAAFLVVAGWGIIDALMHRRRAQADTPP